MTINIAVIVGRVGQDPDIKYFESGKVKTTFSIATSHWNSQKKTEETDWHNIECWDKQAEFVGEYVKKGSLVSVDGYLKQSKWTSSNGEEKERFSIDANQVRILSKKGGSNE